jgi:hypothetical protein
LSMILGVRALGWIVIAIYAVVLILSLVELSGVLNDSAKDRRASP